MTKTAQSQMMNNQVILILQPDCSINQSDDNVVQIVMDDIQYEVDY